MLKHVLQGFGWLWTVSAAFGIGVKLLGSDAAVLRYAGNSRNIDTALLAFTLGLILLGLSAIIDRLDAILNDRRA